jgi:hypothetical protein
MALNPAPAAVIWQVALAIRRHSPYVDLIDFWPDNRAVTPWHARRTFRRSPNIDEPSTSWSRGPFSGSRALTH